MRCKSSAAHPDRMVESPPNGIRKPPIGDIWKGGGEFRLGEGGGEGRFSVEQK